MKSTPFLKKVPKIANNIVIRKEYFGGLIFNKDTMSVYEINKRTLNLIKFIDGKKSFGDIIPVCSRILNTDINEVKTFLNILRKGRFIQW